MPESSVFQQGDRLRDIGYWNILYDQLGCGKSDRPTDTTLFTVDRYVRELQTLRDSLGLAQIGSSLSAAAVAA